MSQNPNPSHLDPGQIVKRAFDDPNDAIRTSIVSGSITVTEAALGQQGQPAPADVKVVGGVDGNGDVQPVHTNTSGDVQVDVLSSILPTGASTSANQTTTNTILTAFSNKTAGSLVPDAFDEQVITYVGASTDISTVTYKLTGSTVATLTFSYDGSNRLVDVLKT